MAQSELLRFVVLRHEQIDSPHFDLMFETSAGSALTTWRSERWPVDRPTVLTRLGEHRRAYLDYEGTVSDGRGMVRRVARGTCRIDRLAGAGPDTFWTVRFDDPMTPPLSIKHVDDDRWLAVPACG